MESACTNFPQINAHGECNVVFFSISFILGNAAYQLHLLVNEVFTQRNEKVLACSTFINIFCVCLYILNGSVSKSHPPPSGLIKYLTVHLIANDQLCIWCRQFLV